MSSFPPPGDEVGRNRSPSPGPTTKRIVNTWWPLAASWLLMAVELPTLSAVVARLPDPETHLAAWGGVVFPLALIVESPVIMLLAASTALSRDWATYRQVQRYMMRLGAALTVVHVLLAFTPLYDLLVVRVLGVPAPIVEPARLGLRIMTPWTWSIAYRRFQQGVLIRFGHSRAVGMGTLVRLTADSLALGIGYSLGTVPGIVVAASAVASGVISEAVYAGLRVRPVLREQVMAAKASGAPINLRSFLEFYVPLAMTSLLTLVVQPMGSAAISRMPEALHSLAAWPVVSGLVFMLRSPGVAFHEVVVALLEEAGAVPKLRRFALMLAALSSLLLVLVAATPLAEFWFGRVTALSPSLMQLASASLWFALPLPALGVAQSWFQGYLVHARRTRAITESVVLFLTSSSVLLLIGVAWAPLPGIHVGWAALSLGTALQVAYLAWRARPTPPRL